MRLPFSARRRKQRRALHAEADRRGVSVDELPNIVPRKELWTLIDNAAPKLNVSAWGLPATATLDDRPSSGVPPVEAAVVAAAGGEWLPAAEVLVESYGDWDLRARAVEALASVAANDDGWLVAWQAARPDDGHAAVVDCAARTALAWQLRGRAPAAKTTAKQGEDFHRVLADAESAAKRAVLALPDDPTPRATMVEIARGLRYDHADFDRVWQELVERAPLHRHGHEAALEYWSARWRGSHERMFAFAQQAADRSPSLSVLVLRAAMDVRSDEPKVWRRPAVRAALDVLLAWLETDGANSVNARDDLGFAAIALVENKRGADAVRMFQRLGDYAGGAPWNTWSIPVAGFNHYRVRACKLTTSRWGRSGTWLNGRSVRYVAGLGAQSFTEYAPKLLWAVKRSPHRAPALVALLTHVCSEQRLAKRYDVAAAVARVNIDICRPRGAELELFLAAALNTLAFSHQQLGEPALDVAREGVEILERHLSDQSQQRAYAAALPTLARELSRAGQHDAAVETAQRATDIERRLNGVNLLAALSCLHDVLTTAGRDDEALLTKEELERRAAIRPPER